MSGERSVQGAGRRVTCTCTFTFTFTVTGRVRVRVLDGGEGEAEAIGGVLYFTVTVPVQCAHIRWSMPVAIHSDYVGRSPLSGMVSHVQEVSTL